MVGCFGFGQMEQSSAQTYARALSVWGQWLRQWCRTRDGRVLRTALACEGIAKEKYSIWQAELKSSQSVWVARAERAARKEFAVAEIMRQIRRDKRLLHAKIIAAVQLADGRLLTNRATRQRMIRNASSWRLRWSKRLSS